MDWIRRTVEYSLCIFSILVIVFIIRKTNIIMSGQDVPRREYVPHGAQVDLSIMDGATGTDAKYKAMVAFSKFMSDWHMFFAMKGVNAGVLRDLDTMVKWQLEKTRVLMNVKPKEGDAPPEKKPRHEDEIMAMEAPKP